jgi:peptidoglycan hydrolase-like protein with peptidoglycan-binding domain
MPRGMSIHIGLNHVDPSCYGGWDGALSGCINDATDMRAIAQGLGYSPSVLLTEAQATADRVILEIGQAAQQLVSDDILFLTYSGHGGQVADVNTEEQDSQDETWVLWDRQLLDDELYALWSRFAPGVRVVMLSDSCHSGTVLRMMATYSDLADKVKRSKGPPSERDLAALRSLETALQLQGTRDASTFVMGPTANGGTHRSAPADGGGMAMAPAATAVAEAPAAAPTAAPMVRIVEVPPIESFRTMPPDVQAIVNGQRDVQNAAIQFVAGPSERAEIGASVILISGCQDFQLSLDGARNGLFTEKLKQVWNNGQFGGDYRGFASAIVALMPANQTPNFATTGAANTVFEAQRPFTIGAGSVMPSSTRPTLRYGSTGPDVTYLQERLQRLGYSLTVDGIFGDGTHGRVIEFQQSRGLVVDGVVGPNTWQAIEGATPATPTQPTTPTAPAARPTLRRGSRGPDVSYLQTRLQAFGHFLVVDGDFGQRTESAVLSFQSSSGLTADGVVGPATWAALG